MSESRPLRGALPRLARAIVVASLLACAASAGAQEVKVTLSGDAEVPPALARSSWARTRA
jgi:hypothetical protein